MKNYHFIKHTRIFFLIIIFVLILQGSALSIAQNPAVSKIKAVRAKITNIIDIDEKNDYQYVELTILEGDYKKIKFNTDFYSTYNFYGITLRIDDEVFVTLNIDKNRIVKGVVITNIVRDKYIIYLFLGFIGLLLLIGGVKGLRSILSLILSFFVIIKVLLPLVIQGYNPVYITIILCSILTIFALILIGGYNRKTISAILGTLCGLTIAACLAITIGDLSHITGVVDDEFYLLQYLPLNSSFSYQGLLFAGIIIGSLGAVMDVSMSIASAMNELKENSYHMSTLKLIRAGMNVGRDTIGTMTNTLILAYAGGSIDMLILLVAENKSLYQIINREIIVSEILRSMAGSIGLLITVPVTAIFAGYLIPGKHK